MASHVRVRLVATRLAVALVLTFPVFVTGMGTAPALAQVQPVDYAPPVDGPIVERFQAPAHRYGPGNRGLKYDPPVGTPVRAAADGTVTFAGTVGNTRHVTVLHADGLRTTYSFVDKVLVRRGMRVVQGDPVGIGGPGFHFGARDGDTYIDPELLFGDVKIRVRLIPHTPVADIGLSAEQQALRVINQFGGGGLIGNLGDLGSSLFSAGHTALEWGGLAVDTFVPDLDQVTAFAHVAAEMLVLTSPVDFARELATAPWIRECTKSGTDVPVPNRGDRVAVTVAGYGSTSRPSASIDELRAQELGYADGDVVRYSYNGGRIPDSDVSGDLASIAERSYESADTFGDLRVEGRQLADLIEEVVRRRPGVPVDVYAHSQGGIVTRLALQELAARGSVDDLGVVVTIGTPHGGADIATVAQVMGPADHGLFAGFVDFFDAGINANATSVSQMAETSSLMGGLGRNGVPEGVDFRTIGARGDLIVAGDKTKVSGQDWAMVDLTGPAAHGSLPGASATTRELQLALAGEPPGCRGPLDTFLDVTIPRSVTLTTNLAVIPILAVPG